MANIYTLKQTTIINPVSCYGIGVHSGKKTQLTLEPALKNTGIVFIRTDVRKEINSIEASYLNVSDTSMSTTITNSSGIKVSTIEHLLAAISGCNIDNVIVKIDGPEIPIMDGSSKIFVFMIECAGLQFLNAPKKSLRILKEVRVIHHDCEIICSPSDQLQLNLTIDFPSKVIGKQSISFNNLCAFKNSIADARTFGFIHELDYLKSRGLAQGASLDNAIGIENDIVLNHNGLRYSDEFVRHKLVDLIGDLRTSLTGTFLGNINAYKTGHALNNQFLRTLFSDPYSYEWC